MKFKKVYSALFFSFCIQANIAGTQLIYADEVKAVDPEVGVSAVESPAEKTIDNHLERLTPPKYIQIQAVQSIEDKKVESQNNREEHLENVPTTSSEDIIASSEQTVALTSKEKSTSNENNIEKIKEENIKEQTQDIRRMIVAFEADKRESVLEALKSIPTVQLKYTYEKLFDGVSVDVSANELSKLYSIQGVKTIQESQPLAPQMMSAKDLTGVIEAQSKRKNTTLDGRGLVIASIDSGVDITHPDLRLDEDDQDVMNKRKIKEVSKEGPFTNKVPHGFNYLSGTTNLIDDVPTGHGMHIAGILAGNSKDEKGLHGLAPNAQLLVYKVFSSRRGEDGHFAYVGDDAAFNAMEDAIKHGADIISLSIGRRGTGLAGDIYDEAIRRANEAGVVVVAAVGNYGSSTSLNTNDIYIEQGLKSKDASTLVGVAAHPLVIGVGSVTNTSLYVPTLKMANETFKYTHLNEKNSSKLPTVETRAAAVFVGRGMDEAIKTANSKGAYKGKVVVAMRGGEDLKDKIARFKDALGVIIVNDSISFSQGNYETHPVTGFDFLSFDNNWAISLSYTDGQKLIEEVNKNHAVDLMFTQVKQVLPVRDTPSISGFSSLGGTLDLEIKPDVVAPGEDIYSSINHGKYGLMSGTSMASPHVAGMSALLKGTVDNILSKKGADKTYQGLNNVALNKILLMNTAKPLIDQELKKDEHIELEYSPRRQGAGLVNLDDALATQAILTYEGNKGSIALKEIDKKRRFTLKMSNYGNKKLRFKVEHSGVLSSTNYLRHRRNEDGPMDSQVIHPQLIKDATLTHDELVEIVQDGQAEINFELNVGSANDQFVEGYIYFKSLTEGQPDLSIPYMGYQGKWSKESIFDAPVWNEKAYTKMTMLMLPSFKSHDENKYDPIGIINEGDTPNPEWYAMANITKANGKIHKVVPRIIFMRDALDYDVAIVDGKTENSRLIRTLQTGHFARKYVSDEKSGYETPNELHTWTGDQYNAIKGEMEAVPEGQYYYRVRARVNSDSPYETMYLPIRVDNTAPQVTATINDSQLIDIKTTDNHAIKKVVIRGKRWNSKEVAAEKIEDTHYQIQLPEDWTKETVVVHVEDFAGNYSEVEFNSKDGKFVNPSQSDNKIDQDESLEEREESNETTDKPDKHRKRRNKIKHAIEDEEEWDDDEEDYDEASDLAFTDGETELKHGTIFLKSRLGKDDLELNEKNQLMYTPGIYLKAGQTAYVTNVNTHYNFIKGLNQYQPMHVMTVKPSDPEGDWEHEAIELADGTNIIKLIVKSDADDQVQFEKSYLVFVDITDPEVTLDESLVSGMTKDEDDDETYNIYSKNGIVYLKGTVSDNLDGWKLYVNNNMIDSFELFGEFDQNKREFYYELPAKENDYLSLKAIDSFGNQRDWTFRVKENDQLIIPKRPTINQMTKREKEWKLDENLTLSLKDMTLTEDSPFKLTDLFESDEFISAVWEKDYDLSRAGKHIIKGRLYKGNHYNDVTYAIQVMKSQPWLPIGPSEPLVEWNGSIVVDGKVEDKLTYKGTETEVSNKLQKFVLNYLQQTAKYKFISVKHENNEFSYFFEQIHKQQPDIAHPTNPDQKQENSKQDSINEIQPKEESKEKLNEDAKEKLKEEIKEEANKELKVNSSLKMNSTKVVNSISSTKQITSHLPQTGEQKTSLFSAVLLLVGAVIWPLRFFKKEQEK
ncbi:S8 family serine peptidase [Atopobacter phocae]|uniref:S8 family serine peptidase n=1 Tax=Atopobacter phocae TaxID=136492 RepID=UPI00046EE911|nr:S8 family serine peptidase [Atopobacter phocae]